MLFFIRLFKGHIRQMAIGTGLGFLALASGVGLLGLAAWFLTKAALAGLDPASAHLFNFFFPSIGVRVLALGRTAARYGERLACHDATFAVLESLRTWFYGQIEPLGPTALGQYRSGDILARIGADIDALDNLYIRVLSPSAVALAAALTISGLLLALDSRLAAAALGFYALAGASASVAAATGWSAGRDLVRDSAGMRSAVVEGVQGLAEILIFDSREAFFNRFSKLQTALIRDQRRLRRCGATGQALILLWAGLGLNTALYIGAGLVRDFTLSGPVFALAVLVVWGGFETYFSLAEALIFLGHTREAGRRIIEVAGQPPAVVFPAAGAAVPRRFDLACDQINFAHRPDAPAVFRNFSLAIAQGAKIAVVGPSGCGKSTLVHLLMRFADPQTGTIRIGGTDIAALAENDLRKLMGVLDQQGHLFGATIRANLLLAQPDATDEQLHQALEAVYLDELVRSFTDGLDTWIGEAGRTLSGGQARRLALARVVLKQAPIWVLDEPFASLDRSTADAVMRSLIRRCGNRTLILITHQRFGLERMDRIIDLGSW